MNETTQDAASRPGESSIRVSGKFFSIDTLIEGVASHTVSPSNLERFGSALLLVVLFVAINVSGFHLGGFGSLVVALGIHEAGHGLGMLLVGWSKVTFGIGLFGPVTWAQEDISAGRKAIVAIAGPAISLIAAMAIHLVTMGGSSFFSDLSRTLFFITFLNLLPIKPFDGYVIMEHVLFVRHPKLEMFYLGISGVVLFLGSLRLTDFSHTPDHFAFFGIFGMIYSCSMFYGIKKLDNMADMVMRLRRDAHGDFQAGCFSAKTIKNLEFSLAMFDLRNEISVVGFLRELWDKAWEEPPNAVESAFVIILYAMLVVAFLYSTGGSEVVDNILRAMRL